MRSKGQREVTVSDAYTLEEFVSFLRAYVHKRTESAAHDMVAGNLREVEFREALDTLRVVKRLLADIDRRGLEP